MLSYKARRSPYPGPCASCGLRSAPLALTATARETRATRERRTRYAWRYGDGRGARENRENKYMREKNGTEIGDGIPKTNACSAIQHVNVSSTVCCACLCTQAAAQATLLYCDFSAARAGLASVEASAALVAAAPPPLPLPPGRTPSGSAGAIIGATIWRAARNASTKGMRARSCSVK